MDGNKFTAQSKQSDAMRWIKAWFVFVVCQPQKLLHELTSAKQANDASVTKKVIAFSCTILSNLIVLGLISMSLSKELAKNVPRVFYQHLRTRLSVSN